MTSRHLSSIAALLLVSCAHAQPLHAQEAPAAGSFQITEIQNGWVVAPDFRFTRMDDHSTTLAGAYGGYDIDRTLLVGGAFYWSINGHNDLEAHYGGGLVRWTVAGHQTVSVSIGALIGFGDGEVTRTYAQLFGTPPPTARPHVTPISGTTLLRVEDGFFVAEPQFSVILRLAPWARLDLGASYRTIGSSDIIQHALEGPSGSIALRLGGK
jgi:hypothetical protein